MPLVWIGLGVLGLVYLWRWHQQNAVPTPNVVIRYDDPRVATTLWSQGAPNVDDAHTVTIQNGQVVAFVYPPGYYPVGGQNPGTPVSLVGDSGWDIPWPGQPAGLRANISQAVGPGVSSMGAYSTAGIAEPNATSYLVQIRVA